MTYFARYQEPDSGFVTVAGRDDGLRQIVLAAGQLGADEGGPVHLHHGEESFEYCPAKSTSWSPVSDDDARPATW